MTIHFIDNDWQLRQFDLKAQGLPHPHNAETISAALVDMIKQFSLKVEDWKYSVTDGGKNYMKAIKIGPSDHIYCAAHKLSVTLKNILANNEPIQTLINKIRAICKIFRKSTTLAQQLQDECLQHKNDYKKYFRLVIDCKTRWNSIFFMLKRFLELSDRVSAVVKRYLESVASSTDKKVIKRRTKLTSSMPNIAEFVTLKQTLIVLESLFHLTELLCVGEYPSLAQKLPFWTSTRKSLYELDVTDASALRLRDDIVKAMNIDYFEEITAITASFLDPRFKALHFLPKYQHTDAKIIEKVHTTIKDAINGQLRGKTIDPPQPLQSVPSSNVPEVLTGASPAKKRVWEDAFGKIVASARNLGQEQLEIYLNMKPANATDDIFQWWKQREHLFPELAKVAKRFLSIPATSVPSERLWSRAGLTMTDRRTSMSPSTLEKLLSQPVITIAV